MELKIIIHLHKHQQSNKDVLTKKKKIHHKALFITALRLSRKYFWCSNYNHCGR